MPGRYIYVGLFCALVGLAGCATTDDPREGGLFSYNPQAYERRLDERQARLEDIGRQNQAEQERSRQLEAERMNRQTERDSLVRRMTDMDEDIKRAEADLYAFRGKTEAAEKRRWQLSVKLKSVKKQLAEIKANQASVAAQQQEVERLRRTLDRLLEEAEALSKL